MPYLGPWNIGLILSYFVWQRSNTPEFGHAKFFSIVRVCIHNAYCGRTIVPLDIGACGYLVWMPGFVTEIAFYPNHPAECAV
jgi:hypothetical protein